MKPRILVVAPTPPPYHGGSVITENLLQSDLSEQFDFILLDIADRRGISNIGALEIKNIYLAAFHGLKFIYLLIRFNPDLIYLQVSQGIWGYLRDLLFLLPSRLFQKKVLIHLHGGAFAQFYKSMPSLLSELTRYVFKKEVWGVVLGKCLISQFVSLLQPERVFVVPNGIRIIEKLNDTCVSINGKIRILYLANLMQSKGFLELLSIVPEVVSRCPNTTFVFAGEKTHNAEMQKARSLVIETQLEEVVNMPGVVTGREKEELLRNTDIFVFPPRAQEGQPLVILEAMSAGLPVISTERGAIAETIVDGVTGFIVPPGDGDELLKKLGMLIEDENLRLKMGMEGRKRFLMHYTCDRWVSDMKAVFEEVLGRKY